MRTRHILCDVGMIVILRFRQLALNEVAQLTASNKMKLNSEYLSPRKRHAIQSSKMAITCRQNHHKSIAKTIFPSSSSTELASIAIISLTSATSICSGVCLPETRVNNTWGNSRESGMWSIQLFRIYWVQLAAQHLKVSFYARGSTIQIQGCSGAPGDGSHIFFIPRRWVTWDNGSWNFSKVYM